jgi:allantoinase
VEDNAEHIGPLAAVGVRGYKCFLIDPGCDGFQMIHADGLERSLPQIARTGLPLQVHAELAGPILEAQAKLRGADWRRYDTYLASRPDEAELAAIRWMLELCRKHRFHLHIVHLSTAQAVEMLRAARAEGLPVTVETCPHYLCFAAEEIPDGATEFKCAPPIRSAANRELLWQALRAGVIDMVVTDHSPCPLEMKQRESGRFDVAWGGIAALGLALPVMWTASATRGATLTELCRWMADAPARMAGLSKRVGALRAGCDANFVVFDTEAEFTVATEHLHFRHKLTPYLGARLRGEVRATYLRGEIIYADGKIVGAPQGVECR